MTVFTVLQFIKRFFWDCSFFNQYSYYRDLFCLGTALPIHDRHRHRWLRYIDTTTIMVWCMSLLLFYILLQWLYYFITFNFKLTNGSMVKWWMLKWCNGKIKIRIGRFFSQKYRICSFVLFLNTAFSQKTKQSITFNCC